MTKVSLGTGTKETPDLLLWHSPEITVTKSTKATVSYQTAVLRSGLTAEEYLPICSTNTEGMLMLRNTFLLFSTGLLVLQWNKRNSKVLIQNRMQVLFVFPFKQINYYIKMTPLPPKVMILPATVTRTKQACPLKCIKLYIFQPPITFKINFIPPALLGERSFFSLQIYLSAFWVL